jgi:hypothetical protein
MVQIRSKHGKGSAEARSEPQAHSAPSPEIARLKWSGLSPHTQKQHKASLPSSITSGIHMQACSAGLPSHAISTVTLCGMTRPCLSDITLLRMGLCDSNSDTVSQTCDGGLCYQSAVQKDCNPTACVRNSMYQTATASYNYSMDASYAAHPDRV